MSDAVSGAVEGAIQADVVIIGAGPCGLFQIFELGLLGIRAHIVDSLKHPGGQCSELYPEKPIYDIPALPVCGAQELIDRLLQQIKPFEPRFHLGQEVAELARRDDGRFFVRTALDTTFLARTVVIAAGLGSFQPKKLAVEGADLLESRQLHYRVRDAARVLPVAGVVLLLVPLLWTPSDAEGAVSNSAALLYVFGVWGGLILAAFVLSRLLRLADDAPGEDPGP